MMCDNETSVARGQLHQKTARSQLMEYHCTTNLREKGGRTREADLSDEDRARRETKTCKERTRKSAFLRR